MSLRAHIIKTHMYMSLKGMCTCHFKTYLHVIKGHTYMSRRRIISTVHLMKGHNVRMLRQNYINTAFFTEVLRPIQM